MVIDFKLGYIKAKRHKGGMWEEMGGMPANPHASFNCRCRIAVMMLDGKCANCDKEICDEH